MEHGEIDKSGVHRHAVGMLERMAGDVLHGGLCSHTRLTSENGTTEATREVRFSAHTWLPRWLVVAWTNSGLVRFSVRFVRDRRYNLTENVKQV